MDLTKLRDQLIAHEGLRLKPYLDTVGKLTIGVGRNLDDVGISEAEALDMLDADIERVAAGLDRHMPWWRELSEPRQRALADMCFNLGMYRLQGFKKMLAALEAGEYEQAAAEALDSKWAGQVGQRAHTIAKLIREG